MARDVYGRLVARRCGLARPRWVAGRIPLKRGGSRASITPRFRDRRQGARSAPSAHAHRATSLAFRPRRTPRRPRLGRRPLCLQPPARPASRRGRLSRRRRRRGRGRRLRPRSRPARRAAGDRPQPRTARQPRRHRAPRTSAGSRRSASTRARGACASARASSGSASSPRLSAHGLAALARLLARRRDRRLLARRRHGLAGAQVRAAGQRGDRARSSSRPTASSCAPTPTTTRTCSGRCAAAAATSAS